MSTKSPSTAAAPSPSTAAATSASTVPAKPSSSSSVPATKPQVEDTKKSPSASCSRTTAAPPPEAPLQESTHEKETEEAPKIYIPAPLTEEDIASEYWDQCGIWARPPTPPPRHD